MKLDKFLLRYFPPGICLQYTKGGKAKSKVIDFLDLSPQTDITELAKTVARNEPLITPLVEKELVELLKKLQQNLFSNVAKYIRHKTLKTHLLPLTNIAFDKLGTKCLTGSYDRTCKLWDVNTGKEIFTLTGHKNVVYAVSFNYPFGDKILTGSFDKSAKIWSTETGECCHTFWGHQAEVVAVHFNPERQILVTASMDKTARIYSIATGQELGTLEGHTGEVIAAQFSNDGKLLITGSFDKTIRMWDTQVNNCSIDTTAKLWDPRMFKCTSTITGHNDEVLDIALNYSGRSLVTASADCTACVWNIYGCTNLISTLSGHSMEVSKACFSPGGGLVLTASKDNSARLWDVEKGTCGQILDGHTDELFSCAFSYYGDTIITASKDNTCRIWRLE